METAYGDVAVPYEAASRTSLATAAIVSSSSSTTLLAAAKSLELASPSSIRNESSGKERHRKTENEPLEMA